MSLEILLPNASVSPEVVIGFISDMGKEAKDKIRTLPHWERRIMTPRSLSNVLFWHFNPSDPDHVGQILTNHGKSQRLADVAKVYINNLTFLKDEYPDFTSKVKGICKAIEAETCMPPLLIMAGRRPNSLSLVDGNFRALALMVQGMINPGRDWQIEAFVGRKLYPWEGYL